MSAQPSSGNTRSPFETGTTPILEKLPEQEFDDLTALAAQLCEVPIALVFIADEQRQWIKARIGIEEIPDPRKIAFCAHTVAHGVDIFEVHDARLDPRFASDPLVVAAPFIKFYAGVPLIGGNGQAFGALCLMDRRPRTMTAAQGSALRVLARAVTVQVELRKQGRKIAADEKKTHQLLAVAEKSRRALLSVLEDEKLSTQKLRTSEERFRRLIENSSDVILVIEENGRIGYGSPSTVRILGYESEYLIGRDFFEIVHPDDRTTAKDSLLQASTSTAEVPEVAEYRIRHHDQTWRIFQSVGKSMDNSQGGRNVVLNSRDVTESRQMEERFLRAQRMEAIGTLASGVAHDLNNILTPMLMVAGLLKETMVDVRDRDMLAMVEKSAQRGANIISQLLTFSRGVEGARASVQPKYLLKEMMNLMQETFPKNIELQNEIAGDLWTVVVDSTQFHQVLLNLCVNARDAMPEGGRLTLAARNVLLGEKDIQGHVEATPGPHLLVMVSDSGHGIPSAIIGRIFDPFFTTKQLGKGTGLGLSTVLGIVKSHNGFINVYSEPGIGTVFRIYFPATDGVAPAETSTPPLPVAQGKGEFVLIVDDEPHILEALRELLEKSRYRVLTAQNGEEAIRIFIEHGTAIQVVVTDVMMPVMGGLALINTLRVIKPGVKVIATTGLEHEEKTAEFTALGVSAVLAKPFSPSAFLQALALALQTGG
jgi:two-component system cell cycle sensor histidine kinase/response regulator CckA